MDLPEVDPKLTLPLRRRIGDWTAQPGAKGLRTGGLVCEKTRQNLGSSSMPVRRNDRRVGPVCERANAGELSGSSPIDSTEIGRPVRTGSGDGDRDGAG